MKNLEDINRILENAIKIGQINGIIQNDSLLIKRTTINIISLITIAFILPLIFTLERFSENELLNLLKNNHLFFYFIGLYYFILIILGIFLRPYFLVDFKSYYFCLLLKFYKFNLFKYSYIYFNNIRELGINTIYLNGSEKNSDDELSPSLFLEVCKNKILGTNVSSFENIHYFSKIVYVDNLGNIKYFFPEPLNCLFIDFNYGADEGNNYKNLFTILSDILEIPFIICDKTEKFDFSKESNLNEIKLKPVPIDALNEKKLIVKRVLKRDFYFIMLPIIICILFHILL